MAVGTPDFLFLGQLLSKVTSLPLSWALSHFTRTPGKSHRLTHYLQPLGLQENHPNETKHRIVTKMLTSLFRGPQLHGDGRKTVFLNS